MRYNPGREGVFYCVMAKDLFFFCCFVCVRVWSFFLFWRLCRLCLYGCVCVFFYDVGAVPLLAVRRAERRVGFAAREWCV